MMEECRLVLPLELRIASLLETKGWPIKNPWGVGEVLEGYDKNIRP